MEFEMDTPLEKEIEKTEKHLKMLKAGDPEAVFQCPKCKKKFAQLLNYRELEMCGKCFSKTKREELKKLTMDILNGTIENIEIGSVGPFHIPDKPEIVKMLIRTTKGKLVTLKVPEKLIYA